MAVYVDKGGRVQARIRNKLLPRPLYRTFETREEAEHFCKPIEAALAKGIVPPSVKRLLGDSLPAGDIDTLAHAIDAYTGARSLKQHDLGTLDTLRRAFGSTRIRNLTRDWLLDQVHEWKVEGRLTPGSIRKRLGSLRRLFEWLVAERPNVTMVNTVAALPRDIASVNDDERREIEQTGDRVQRNVERDRRLDPTEESAIRAVLAGKSNPEKERAPVLADREELLMLFDLAIESAMRLREMYTLTTDQVNLESTESNIDLKGWG